MRQLPEGCEAHCPICNNVTTQIYLEGEDGALDGSTIGSSRASTSPGRILQCSSCHFGFRQTRSSPEELRELYRQMDPAVYESEIRGRNRTAKHHLNIVQKYRRSGRLLDVGCASGLFLLQASQAGWDVTGIEPNESLCQDAQKILNGRAEIQCTNLEMARLESGFDVITLWDVLEHVPDPGAFLQLCSGLLRSDGYVFLNVPDLDSWEAKILGRRWPLLLPEHLNYFNKDNLAACAKQARLSPVRFGRRFAWFSLKYVSYRVAQHGIIGSSALRQMAGSPLGRALVPVSLGEMFGIFKPIRLLD